jgi:hypothetical protein
VQWLSALLRIAEGLDRSHYQLVRSVRVSRNGAGVSIRVDARREAQLEIWAARRRVDLLSRLLKKRVKCPAVAEQNGRSSAKPRPRRRAGGPGPIRASQGAAGLVEDGFHAALPGQPVHADIGFASMVSNWYSRASRPAPRSRGAGSGRRNRRCPPHQQSIPDSQ